MKISSSPNNNYNIYEPPSFGLVSLKKKPSAQRKKPKIKFTKMPEKPIYLPNFIGEAAKWTSEFVGLPEQKLFLAATAFIMQPAIDMKFAEEDKKSDVAIKSAAKALAGGITGVTIRGICERYFKNRIGYDEKGKLKVNLANDLFFPKDSEEIRAKSIVEYEHRISKYCVTLGNICALAAMILVTNEKVDVPLTSDFQDLFTNVARDNKSWEDSFNEVAVSRKNKIQRWIQSKIDYLKMLDDKANRIKNIINEEYPKKKKSAGLNKGVSNA